jgi:hypothetical protein
MSGATARQRKATIAMLGWLEAFMQQHGESMGAKHRTHLQKMLDEVIESYGFPEADSEETVQ